MIKPFHEVLEGLEAIFRQLEERVPPPVPVPCKGGVKLRYEERTLEQALLQKLARMISGLHAMALLLGAGFCQEMGVLQRTLDDLEEDIMFLSIGAISGEWTDRHNQYLEHFWSEDLDGGMVRRDKIRAYVNRAQGNDDHPGANDEGRALFKAYSGYVHAASVNIVDMCSGEPPRYHLAGMRDNPLYPDHLDDAWNQFFRALTSTVFIAKAFGDERLVEDRVEAKRHFETKYAHKVYPAG